MRTSIATVCLSGGLTEKLHACAAAGFDGVEIMEADLLAAFESPEEIQALCRRLGLSIDMYQPLRDIEGVSTGLFEENLRRAEAKFELMERLGTRLVLLCSNVATATVADETVAAAQLGALADLAAEHGIRIAYEALAWGRYVSDYRDAWRLVQLADRPNLGLCLDSFHILSRGHDPSEIESIDAEKLFFLQLADAPALDLDVLSWSRHHRLFPGEGAFDLVGFLGHVLRAGYDGPLSLEVFNDTFRQTDVRRTAQHAQRSLRWLADRAAAAGGWSTGRLAPAQPPLGVDFVEIAGQDLAAVDEMLDRLGFAFAGRHRSKPVRLWTAGDASIILNEQDRGLEPRIAALGLLVADAEAAAEHARGIGAPPVFRRISAGDQELPAVFAPDGTEVYWADGPASASWRAEFGGGLASADGLLGIVDHVNLTSPWQDFDETVLFGAGVLGLEAEASSEVPGPLGLVRSVVMRSADGAVRLAMNLAPPAAPALPRHLAIRVDDAVAVASAARQRGMEFLPVPDNYYDDLAARFALDPAFGARLRGLGLLFDRDDAGAFIHGYTPTIGGVFLEIVQRIDDYRGYGATDAPIRLAAQRVAALQLTSW
ncbi:sugar phosphate isomerase/epimerase and 4-hydroxyphenylpyruvate domain-containing protein [Leucobacter allii]|uniref:3-dehydroshikimate dehydratase n=1 Tax=Leucobacter allii TaxID=2932247 RepID=A0ABY4FMJ4_9MICO|nr:sugar phosphate isomerase/epimerase and 4-hydroxyphenylpyruvate domain-containing protein [Leucobacter allii]UOQ57492.1 sugar phosphate isomerase/epimerase and 4-hydroxyphenylpyruvate domain-containing protein [Leucobacter allii]UOR01952.1 sugar phosphate isomerase/epimerase and 4-hydroxyphenylpyruvate domain-containing protein [Leucobacter allii]